MLCTKLKAQHHGRSLNIAGPWFLCKEQMGCTGWQFRPVSYLSLTHGSNVNGFRKLSIALIFRPFYVSYICCCCFSRTLSLHSQTGTAQGRSCHINLKCMPRLRNLWYCVHTSFIISLFSLNLFYQVFEYFVFSFINMNK